MTLEDQHVERKSLRLVSGRSADWDEIARQCVGFANGIGGRLLVGIEDGQTLPPPGQVLPEGLPDLLRRRIGERTVNVQALPQAKVADNGGAYVEVTVTRALAPASTTDGRFYLRVGDSCQPLVGADVLRLATERTGLVWEAMPSPVPRAAADADLVRRITAALRASDRVKPAVKEKDDDELLAHYGLVDGQGAAARLTQLGVLLVGTAAQRSALGSAPIVQAVKFDEQGRKVNKWVWDDHVLPPTALPDAVWQGVPDFRESYELPDGLYRRQVPAYDRDVVRELLVNALVHRPYTQQGDIFLNLHPDRLEVVNPGRLPLGVTPHTVLHASRRRNEALARVFHDLGLMEREGTGIDLVYERQLTSGRPPPVLAEGVDSTHATVQRRIVAPEVIALVERADARFQLNQRERITLGVLALSDGLTAAALAERLDVAGAEALRPWLGRLQAWGLVGTAGRTRARRYFVEPVWLHSASVPVVTTLARIEPHRLRALVEEDLARYPDSSTADIHRRVAPELAARTVKRALDALAADGRVAYAGEKRWRRYRLVPPPGHSPA